MRANDRQHGGEHYRRHAYQHWDFVCDTRLPYLLGCATKYASRWQQKGGVEDLKKMVHFLDKAEEKGMRVPLYDEADLSRYCAQLGPIEASLVHYIMEGEWEDARTYAKDIIQEEKAANAT